MSADCLACGIHAGTIDVPGGIVHRSERWVVDHCVGPLGIGSLVVKPVRHVTRVAELDDGEAAELGLLLRKAAAVVDELLRPEQVYTWLFSHAGGVPVHVHWVVQPARREDMDALGAYGPRLTVAMFDRGEPPDPGRAAAFAEEARRRF